MFWYLFSAHLLADFPLQPSWIVLNKNRLSILSLHVTIHFLVGLVLISLVNISVWPYVTLLVIIHFMIDFGKNYINKIKPNWIIGPYLIDQLIHIISIIFVSILIEVRTGLAPFAPDPMWLILLNAYLLITYVWYISERIISFKQPVYFNQVVEKAWSRMLARAVISSLIIFSWTNITSSNLMFAGLLSFPYDIKSSGLRALVTDLIVSIGGAVFFFWLI